MLAADELPVIAQKFADAARRAVIAGFDCVEVHCGHVYLLHQFLSPIYNKRADEYGGSHENRARFPRMVLERVREVVGPKFPITLRVSADDMIEGGNTLDDALELFGYLDDLVDIYNVSVCVGATVFFMVSGMSFEEGWRTGMAKVVREKFKKPVITQGNIQSPAVAERLLAEGYADFIGMGRALIADPQWVNKVKSGREDELRRCIYCNIGCNSSRNRDIRAIHCTVNPDLIDEDDYKERKVKKPVNVVVVGGGTSGMEAACTAAEVGCRSFVFEQSGQIGGMTRKIARLPSKRRIENFARWLEGRASRLDDVHIFTNRKADVETIRAFKPHVLVNATGSRPLLPNIPGLRERVDKEGGRVYSITGIMRDVDSFGECAGKSVVIIGGGAVGLDAVEFFAEKDAKVTVVEMTCSVGGDLDLITRGYMNYLLKKYNVTVMTDTKLVEVQDNAFVVESGGKRITLVFDVGAVCLGMIPVNEGLDELRAYCESEGVEFMNIGDSKKPGKLINGSSAGRDILVALSQMGLL
jgi:NADPH-dependent 2,4-dienoyl-CoA reductase/sulfur reductase-like enzyme